MKKRKSWIDPSNLNNIQKLLIGLGVVGFLLLALLILTPPSPPIVEANGDNAGYVTVNGTQYYTEPGNYSSIHTLNQAVEAEEAIAKAQAEAAAAKTTPGTTYYGLTYAGDT
jgi:hypothetical protein